jgi:hypothetical protein
MTHSRHINRPKFRWDVDSDALLRELYPDFPSALLAKRFSCTLTALYQHARKLGLKKSEAYLASPYAQRLRRGGEVGKAYRFPKGHVPANKGIRRPGWAPGRMASTQFKKGSMSGAAQHNYVPIGTERLSKDGYLERKVTDDHPVPARRWVGVHILIWQEANGPIPDGHCLAFIDRDKTHIALDNLELITRAERMRRNTIHRYPAEVKKAIRLVGKLKRTIEARDEKQD